MSRFRGLLLGAFSLAVIGVAWQVLVELGVLDPFLVSSPSRIAGALWDQATSGILWRNIRVSALELVAALAMAIGIGIPLGVALGWYRRVSLALDPLVWLGYSAPIVALYPVFTLTFGLGSGAVVAMTVLLAIPPIVINTARGVRNVDRTLIRAARSFGAGDEQLLRKVALPGALPLVMAGMRLAIGRAFIGVVVGELFAGTAGLGWAIAYYGGLLETTDMLASVLVVTLLGVIVTLAVGVLERRIDAWRVQT